MASRAGKGGNRSHPFVSGRRGESSTAPPTGLPVPMNGAVNKRDAEEEQVDSSPSSTVQTAGPSGAGSGPSSGPQSTSSSVVNKSTQTHLDTFAWNELMREMEAMRIRQKKDRNERRRLKLRNMDLNDELREMRESQPLVIVEDENMEPGQEQ